jgi:hypothetical protein
VLKEHLADKVVFKSLFRELVKGKLFFFRFKRDNQPTRIKFLIYITREVSHPSSGHHASS